VTYHAVSTLTAVVSGVLLEIRVNGRAGEMGRDGSEVAEMGVLAQGLRYTVLLEVIADLSENGPQGKAALGSTT
jgi:hypothetical protein